MTQRCLWGHLRPEKTLLWPRDSQSERNCHSSRSWRCQRPPAEYWHWWSDPPESPAEKHKSSAHMWGFLSTLSVMILTCPSDPPAICQVPPSSSPQWLQLLQSTGWHVSCSQSFLPRILRCQIKTKSVEVPKPAAIAVVKTKHQVYLRDQDWLILSVYKREIISSQYCFLIYL